MPDFDKPENSQATADQAIPAASRAGLEAGGAFVIVYMTFPEMAVAETVGNELVAGGLAACVNIIPGMVSIYRWLGESHRDNEVVMIVKTRGTLAEAVMARARLRHPYDNPAMLVLPVVGGSCAFLDWIADQTAAPSETGG